MTGQHHYQYNELTYLPVFTQSSSAYTAHGHLHIYVFMYVF